MTKYSDAEIERILKALILADDRPSRAVKRLAAFGEPVPLRTVQHLRNLHAAEYDRLRESRHIWVQDEQAEQSERIAQMSAQGEERIAAVILAFTDDELAALSPTTLANAMDTISKVKSRNIDKARTLRGQPTKITETRSLPEIMRAVQRLLPEAKVPAELIEGEAVEVESTPEKP